MTPTQQHRTLQTAAEYGGSFFRALAQAGMLADPSNKQRLFDAFPEFKIMYGPGTNFHGE